MAYLLTFVLGGVAFILATWIWELMTGQLHGRLVRALDEYKAESENRRLMEEFLEDRLEDLGRSEIWYRMGWVWKETRGWTFRSARPLSFVCLGFFALLYVCLWIKTLILPKAQDLRLLLGGRSLLLYVAQKRGN